MFLIIFVIIFVSLGKVYGQDDCVPEAVQVLRIVSNGTLLWEIAPVQGCEITNYIIDVTSDKDEEYHYNTTEAFVDLSFLKICTQWNFTVTSVSNGVLGNARTLEDYIPLRPDANLALYYEFEFVVEAIVLKWDLIDRSNGTCSLEYHLSIIDVELNVTRDVYLEDKSAPLEDISPCVAYQLKLQTINKAYPNAMGPIWSSTFVFAKRRQIAPILKSIDAQATSLNVTWGLEGAMNRCSLITFYLDGGSYFNISLPIYNLTDQSTVSVQVTGLRANSMYYMRGSVENIAGVSQATPIAVQTLEISAEISSVIS